MSRDRKIHGSDVTDGEIADVIMRAREAWQRTHEAEAAKLGITVEDHIRHENARMERLMEEARQKEFDKEKEGK